LWSEVADEDDSPSEVVQRALNALAREQHPYRDHEWHGDPALRQANLAAIETSVERLRKESRRLREVGYAAGAAFAGTVDGVLEWLRQLVFSPDPFGHLGDLVGDPDCDMEGNRKELPAAEHTIYEAVIRSAESDLGWGRDLLPNEPLGAALPREYLEGVVEALFDVWRMLEGKPDVGTNK
jgi:hypothetical protein